MLNVKSLRILQRRMRILLFALSFVATNFFLRPNLWTLSQHIKDQWNWFLIIHAFWSHSSSAWPKEDKVGVFPADCSLREKSFTSFSWHSFVLFVVQSELAQDGVLSCWFVHFQQSKGKERSCFSFLRIFQHMVKFYKGNAFTFGLLELQPPFTGPSIQCTRHLLLSCQHRAGVRPYTSWFHFAESCVFSKQSPPLFSWPQKFLFGSPFFRRYGRNLPSSFTTVLSNAFVELTCSPVSVWSTVMIQ